MRDYISSSVQNAQKQLEDLERQESIIRESRGAENRAKRDEAEKRAKAIRETLLISLPPAAIYEFLNVTGQQGNAAVNFRTRWQESNLKVDCLRELAEKWEKGGPYYRQVFEIPKVDLDVLPAYSFVIQFTFALAQPYISRDEQDFYIIDNPVRKDKVFGFPYIASTSWKGSLRAALWQSGHREQDEPIRRLFGNEKGAEDQKNFRAGRLYFYPTFFTHRSLEIINPQDRRLRSGKDPILFESVPKDTPGVFTLLYVPFDLIGENEQETRTEVAEDLQLVATGLQAMFRTYGFGAKTSSGFGLARETLSPTGILRLQANTSAIQKQGKVASPKPAPPGLPRYLEAIGRLRPEYRTPEGTFRERSEEELKKMSKSDRQMYDKARSWWEREGKHLAEQSEVPAAIEPEPEAQAPSVAILEWPFESFQKLVECAKEIMEPLKSPLTR
jgi:CRISPR-associated protein Cmr2